MSLPFFGTRSKAATTVKEAAPSQEEIERQIAKLKEDSARDVERQLAQQRSAEREDKMKEDMEEAAEDVKERLAPVWKAAEKELETVVKDAEADVKGVKRIRGARDVESTEKGE